MIRLGSWVFETGRNTGRICNDFLMWCPFVCIHSAHILKTVSSVTQVAAHLWDSWSTLQRQYIISSLVLTPMGCIPGWFDFKLRSRLYSRLNFSGILCVFPLCKSPSCYLPFSIPCSVTIRESSPECNIVFFPSKLYAICNIVMNANLFS